jgi:acyl-[acyl-carrier-protein] desaturase
MEDTVVLQELAPKLGELFDRHLRTTKEWFPHKLVPWERAADLDVEAEWTGERMPLPDAVRSALFVNLLTEDNLPYYFETINRVFRSEAWDEWSRRWTAEEMRHSMVIRDYITVSDALDPTELERARMAQVSLGQVPQPQSVADGLAYVALQELATRISHRNTGKLLDDPAGYTVMARVGADENLHFMMYRDLLTASLELDPSGTMCAIERQVRTFEMPGAGIVGFTKHAAAIAAAEIYDLAIHHDQILVPVVLRHWKVEDVEGLNDEAERARDALLSRIERLGKIAKRRAVRAEKSEAVPAGV